MTNKKTWKDFHVTLSDGNLTLKEAYGMLLDVSNDQSEVPYEIQMVENPDKKIPIISRFFQPFPGRTNLENHDYIHLILGRGLLMKDEAFVIGFTMGTTNRMHTWRVRLYSFFAKYVYSPPWSFSDEDIHVFRDAANAGDISDCIPLSEVNFNQYLDMKISDIRLEIGLEESLLRALYSIEKNRYPNDKASMRLCK